MKEIFTQTNDEFVTNFYETDDGDILIDVFAYEKEGPMNPVNCEFTIKNEDLFNLAIMFKQICDKHYDKRHGSKDAV